MPTYPISWTANALRHADDIRARLAAYDISVSRRWLQRLRRRVSLLAHMPRMGRTVPEFDDRELREVIEPPYRIIYHFDGHALFIAAVVDSRQVLRPYMLYGGAIS